MLPLKAFVRSVIRMTANLFSLSLDLNRLETLNVSCCFYLSNKCVIKILQFAAVFVDDGVSLQGLDYDRRRSLFTSTAGIAVRLPVGSAVPASLLAAAPEAFHVNCPPLTSRSWLAKEPSLGDI